MENSTPEPVSLLTLLSALPTQPEPTMATLTAVRRALQDPSRNRGLNTVKCSRSRSGMFSRDNAFHGSNNMGDNEEDDEDDEDNDVDGNDPDAEQRTILAQKLPLRAAAYAVAALQTHATDVRVAHHAVSLLAHPALAAKALAPEHDTLAATLSSALPRRLSQSFRRDVKHTASLTAKARSFAQTPLQCPSQQYNPQHQEYLQTPSSQHQERLHQQQHLPQDQNMPPSTIDSAPINKYGLTDNHYSNSCDHDRQDSSHLSGSASAVVTMSALVPSPILRATTSLAGRTAASNSSSFPVPLVLPRDTPTAVANSIEAAVCDAMANFPFSSAFQHTALAALQNAARVDKGDAKRREAVLIAAIGVMRRHPAHSAILLRGVDLLAFHLNQITGVPSAHLYRAATDMVVASSRKLAATAQGAGAVLLACVAAARWSASAGGVGGGVGSASSPQAGPSVNLTSNVLTSRLSRVGNPSVAPTSLIDPLFCACVVSAMRKHLTVPHVQILGCETVRVAGRLSGKDLISSGAVEAILGTLDIHSSNIAVIDRAIPALRAVILDGSSPKPGLALTSFTFGGASALGIGGPVDVCNRVISAAEACANSASHLSPDTSAVAKVLAVDIRNAVIMDARKIGSFDQSGRRDRFGLRRFVRRWHKKATAPAPAGAAFHVNSPSRKNFASGTASSSRTSYEAQSYVADSSSELPRRDRELQMNAGRVSLPAAPYGGRTSLDASLNDPYRFEAADPYDTTDESQQIRANRRFRSVGGVFATRRRMSRTSLSRDPYFPRPSRDRRHPLSLSGKEVDKLARQPSNGYVFGATAF